MHPQGRPRGRSVPLPPLENEVLLSNGDFKIHREDMKLLLLVRHFKVHQNALVVPLRRMVFPELEIAGRIGA